MTDMPKEFNLQMTVYYFQLEAKTKTSNLTKDDQGKLKPVFKSKKEYLFP